MRKKLACLSFVLVSVFSMQGCTFLVTTFEIGGAAATAEGASTAVQVAQALDVAGTAGDAVSVKETGKTLSDHIVSFLTEKDCKLLRKIRGQGTYCEVYLPKMDTVNRIRVFQIIEEIRPVNGKMGPLTRQAYWNYEHGVRIWDQKLYKKFPHTKEEVKKYQRENSITPQNGNIGPKTIKSLIKYYSTLKGERDVQR